MIRACIRVASKEEIDARNRKEETRLGEDILGWTLGQEVVRKYKRSKQVLKFCACVDECRNY